MDTMDEQMNKCLRNHHLIKMNGDESGGRAGIQNQLQPRFRLLQQMVKQQWPEGSHIAWISNARKVRSCNF